MNQLERRRLIKYALATYFSILAVYLFQFSMTTSIAFSAIFVISYGPTRYHGLSYALNRMLAQVIGVLIGTLLYLLINWSVLSFVPVSQRMALAMTAGLVIVLGIKYHFHLDIAEFTMFTPVFLVLLMTPGNSRYPILRLIYCLIGIIIGSIINFLVYPCPANLWSGLDQKIHRENEGVLHQIDAVLHAASHSAPDHTALDDLLLLSADIDRGLSALRAHTPSRRQIAEEEWARWETQHKLNATCLKVLQQMSHLASGKAGASTADQLQPALQALLLAHQAFLLQSEGSTASVAFTLPGLSSEAHDLLLCESDLILYYRHILDCCTHGQKHSTVCSR